MENIPYRTFTVGFFLDQDIDIIHWAPPGREIFFVDYDTILFTDYYYFYKLDRLEGYDFPFPLPFTDVYEDTMHRDDIALAHKNELMYGRTATRFTPEQYLSRSDAVQITACLYHLIYRGSLLGRQGYDYNPPSIYVDYLGYLQERGLVDSGFSAHAGEPITLAEFLRMINGVEPLRERVASFVDDALDLRSFITRGEAASVLAKLLA